jgi:Protein of unknown function (DUF2971)
VAEIKSYEQPRRLYRYRSLDHFDQETDAIENGYLFCSAYEKLNDPMEGRFTSSRLFKRSPDHRAIRMAIIDNKARIGICSFSEVHNHELMWAHYADHFRGICIGYSVRLLLDNLPPDVSFVRMFYNEKAPTIRRSSSAPQNLAKAVFSNKSYRWLYEREWRMFGHQGRVHYGTRDCVTCVYLGYRIPSSDRKRLTDKLKRLGVMKKEMGIEKYFIKFE